MKLFLRGLAGLVLLVLLPALIAQICGKVRAKKETAILISRLPSLGLKDIQGRPTREHAAGRSIWLIFFHTTCDYCRMEAESMADTEGNDSIDIWMVSTEPAGKLSSFSRRYGLDNRKNVRFFSDTTGVALQLFDVTSVPSSFLYNSDGKLVKAHRGLIKMEAVLKQLNSG